MSNLRTRAASAVAATVMAGAALAACGDNSGGSQGTPSSAPTTSAPVSSAPTVSTSTPPPAAKPKDAAALAKALDLGKVHVWTDETDPNKLLGRPGGYTSAATVIDQGLECKDPAKPPTDCGARIEVFDAPAAATKRSKYIQDALGTSGALGTEYHTVVGGALLRVTGELTPKQAGVYATKFKSVSG